MRELADMASGLTPLNVQVPPDRRQRWVAVEARVAFDTAADAMQDLEARVATEPHRRHSRWHRRRGGPPKR
jgi:hypothetical protein